MAHLAVFVFFSISGYLIATSWRQSPRALPFLSRRVARIFPGLIAVILVSVVAVGPMLTTLSTREYFANPATWGYLAGLLLAPSYLLPGVFADNPTTAVNGSLWTLGPEFVCYLLVLAVGLAALALRSRADWARRVAFVALAIVLGLVFWLSPDKPMKDNAGAMAFFAVGAAFAYIPVRRIPWWVFPPITLIWILGGTISRDVGVTIGWVVVPTLVLALGLRSTPYVRHAARFGDFSYGIYLWAFPVQQTLFHFFPALPLLSDILLVVSITGVLAIASWHLIERRALAAIRSFWRRRGLEPGPRALSSQFLAPS